MTLLVDYRERRLAELLDVPHLVRNLAVGDLVCDYGGGNRWIAERKTASDLAQSIVSGRWRDQLHRLRETGCRIFFLVEGDLRTTTLNYDSNHTWRRIQLSTPERVSRHTHNGSPRDRISCQTPGRKG